LIYDQYRCLSRIRTLVTSLTHLPEQQPHSVCDPGTLVNLHAVNA
jgi:hypothetical protein